MEKKMSEQQTIKELQETLWKQIEGLQEGSISIAEANTVTREIGKIIKTVNQQLKDANKNGIVSDLNRIFEDEK